MSGKKITGNVLIIDDEDAVGIGKSEMLKDAGSHVIYVTNGT